MRFTYTETCTSTTFSSHSLVFYIFLSNAPGVLEGCVQRAHIPSFPEATCRERSIGTWLIIRTEPGSDPWPDTAAGGRASAGGLLVIIVILLGWRAAAVLAVAVREVAELLHGLGDLAVFGAVREEAGGHATQVERSTRFLELRELETHGRTGLQRRQDRKTNDRLRGSWDRRRKITWNTSIIWFHPCV